MENTIENQVQQQELHSKILNQINEEYRVGFQAVQFARDRKRMQLALYNPEYQGEKVNVKLIYQTINTLMSVYFEDSINIEFTGDIIVDDIIGNINKTVLHDFEEMGMDEVNYGCLWDSLFMGVGIKVKT
jgi:predicted transcriptional regulator